MCVRLHEFKSTTPEGIGQIPMELEVQAVVRMLGVTVRSSTKTASTLSHKPSLKPPVLCFLKENINVWAILVNNDQDVLIMLHLFLFINV